MTKVIKLIVVKVNRKFNILFMAKLYQEKKKYHAHDEKNKFKKGRFC